MKGFIKKYLKLTLHLFLVLFVLNSCTKSETDKLFEDSVSVRFEKAELELREALKASDNGWKITYFTDDNILGGYTFLFDFKDDRVVSMSSDLTNDTSASSSEYDVIIGSTLKLSFSTKNQIHNLSDSANYPDQELRGKGYKGDFEFLYYGKEGEDLIFRTNKDFIEVRFTKATAEDWTNLGINSLMEERMRGNPSKPVFRVLTLGVDRYNFLYNVNRRYATATNETLEKKIISFGVGYSTTGIIVSPAIEFDGKKITEFTYDEALGKFVHVVDGVLIASIDYSETPAVPLRGYENITKSNLRYNEIPGLSDSSQAFLDYIVGVRNNFAMYGFTFDRFYYRDMDKDLSYAEIYISQGANVYYVWFDFTKEVKNDKLYMTLTGDTNMPPSFSPLFQPLLDVFFDVNGHYVIDSGKLGPYSNNTFKFIPASYTSYLIHFYDF